MFKSDISTYLGCKMTGIQDNSYTPDYLDSQAEDR